MKKVININFHGRVIPIEETAYEMLQQYISSLREYFDKEEGRDEIVNDIESRVAELMGETLKKGAACITDADVNRIADSMGRPSDFAEAEAEDGGGAGFTTGQTGNTGDTGSRQSSGYTGAGTSSSSSHSGAQKRLYRNEHDKLLAGVSSGLANYLNIDPAIIRVLFVLLAIGGGSGILIYIVLWIVLPSTSLVNNIRKRLYRNPDDKIIGGVCGGLGSYFDISPTIPRIIFAAPFILGIVASIGRNIFDHGFVFAGGSGGFTFILAYVIMWIILPEARTTSEKLEMKGEKVDMNSIRETVVSDLQDARSRAMAAGPEIKEYVSEKGQMMASDIRQATRRRSGLGNAIAILFKAFLYMIGGAIAIGLFIGLIALLGTGVGFLPLRDFFLEGPTQRLTAWGVLFLFLGVPLIAMLIWLIRRMMGVRSNNKFLGYSFTLLWVLGLICVFALAASINRSFSTQVGKQEDVAITQPARSKLYVGLQPAKYMFSDNWLDFDGAVGIDGDSLHLNTIKVSIVKSRDDQYHMHLVKVSRGNSRDRATYLAESINFPIVQTDSLILLPESFAVSNNQKWRNQKVVVLIEVPVGKRIEIDDAVPDNYEYFNIDFGRRRSWRIDWNRDWEETLHWRSNKDMLMTEDGLEWDMEKENRREEWNEAPSPKPTPDTIIPQAPATPDSVIKPAKTNITIKQKVQVNDNNEQPTITNTKLTRAAYIPSSTPLTLMMRII